jgi:hypothetical protein
MIKNFLKPLAQHFVSKQLIFDIIHYQHHTRFQQILIKQQDFTKLSKLKKICLSNLCNNYVISDRLVNGVDGLFKATTSYNNKSYIWIKKFNSKVGITTRFSNSHLYKELDIESSWTPIEALAKEIRIGKNETHLITRI